MKLPCIFLNNQKHQRKWRPHSVPWTFAQRSRSETTDEYLQRLRDRRYNKPAMHCRSYCRCCSPTCTPGQTRFRLVFVVNRRLSGPESAKDTRHFELDLTGWGLSFEVGDSLAVYATNDPQLVDEIIHVLGVTGHEKVPRPRGEPTTLREALLRDYSITQPTPKFLRAILARASFSSLRLHWGIFSRPDRKHDLRETYLWGMEIIDFLLEHPSARFAPEEFVGLLTKLQPRLYSVASSLKAYPDQVHFIVDVVPVQNSRTHPQRSLLIFSCGTR